MEAYLPDKKKGVGAWEVFCLDLDLLLAAFLFEEIL